MSLSDCPDCWETPCSCGSDYASWTIPRLESFKQMIEQVINRKRALDPARNRPIGSKESEENPMMN